MSSRSRKKSTVPHSDSEEVLKTPVNPLKRRRPVSSSPESLVDHQSDSPGSLIDFIVDEAEEDLESEEDGGDGKPTITPPSRKREPAKFPVDSDDEGIAVSSSYEADLVESPKKKVVKPAVRKQATDQESDDNLTQPVQKKRPNPPLSTKQKDDKLSRPHKSSTQRHQISSDPEEVLPHSRKGSDRKASGVKKMVMPDSDIEEIPPVATPIKKKPTKKIKSTDSDIEIVEPVKTTKAKVDVVQQAVRRQDRPASKGQDSPAKKKTKVVKSAETIEDSDSDVLGIKAGLDKGDKMYPGGRNTKAKASNLNGLGSTPPLTTRSRGTVTPSPVKRQDGAIKEKGHSYLSDSPDVDNSAAEGESILGKTRSPNPVHTRASPDWQEWTDDDEDVDKGASASQKVSVKFEQSASSPKKGITTSAFESPKAGKIDALASKKSTASSRMSSSVTLQSDGERKVANKIKLDPEESDVDVFTGPQSVGPNSFKSRLWKALPESKECQVFDEKYLDSYLAARNGYDGNPKLRWCDILSMGSQQYKGLPNGLPRFSSWMKVIDENFEALADAFNFVNDGRYVNLSRISPTRLVARKLSESRFELCINNQTALCFATGCVGESHLFTLQPQQGKSEWTSRFIKVRLHQYEQYRFAAVIGEVARRPVFHTTIWNQAISFGSKLTRREEAQQILNGANVPDDFFDTYVSPQKQSSSTATGPLPLLKDHVPALDFAESIPVYDARQLPEGFQWTAKVFSNLPKYFSLFDSTEFPDAEPEIPINSLVGLGYTVQYYRQGLYNNAGSNASKGKGKVKADDSEPQELCVNLMLQWVLVLGVRL